MFELDPARLTMYVCDDNRLLHTIIENMSTFYF